MLKKGNILSLIAKASLFLSSLQYYGNICLKGGEYIMWYANIFLKSGRNITLSELQSINKHTDSSTIKITKFDEFCISKGQRLTFVGKTSIVTLLSDEIEFIEISQAN
jgi:hypothetical protein